LGRVLALGQAAVVRPRTPVIWSQIVKRMIISVRWSSAVSRWRRGRKWGEMPLNTDRNHFAPPAERKLIARSRCLVDWWEFSARLYEPLVGAMLDRGHDLAVGRTVPT
jgi:hypothetical protein